MKSPVKSTPIFSVQTLAICVATLALTACQVANAPQPETMKPSTALPAPITEDVSSGHDFLEPGLAARRQPQVFVYGTLKRNMPNAAHMSGSSFVGEATTQDDAFSLFGFDNEWGKYPGVVQGGNTRIQGEVYRVDAATMAQLDKLEEIPDVYYRRLIQVKPFGEAWIYYLQPSELQYGAKPDLDGNWAP